MSRFVNQFPAAVISLSEQIENATGVNILSAFQKGTCTKPGVSGTVNGKEAS